MAAHIALSGVLGRISYLRSQHPESLFGLEDVIKRIEKEMSRYVDDMGREKLYDLEDIIDEIIIGSKQRMNRDAFIQILSTFVDLPKQMFYVLAIVDLLSHYKLRKILEGFKFEFPSEGFKFVFPSKGITSAYDKTMEAKKCEYKKMDEKKEELKKYEPKKMDERKEELKKYAPKKMDERKEELKYKYYEAKACQWQSPFPQIKLDLGMTIISPVIDKVAALAFQKQLSSSLRKQAKWLRDEFSLLQAHVEDFDSRQVSEEGMAWIEGLCDVCRSFENVVGLFIDKQQLKQMKKGFPPFKALAWAPNNFMSQHKLTKQFDLMKAKLQCISRTKYHAIEIPKPHNSNVKSFSPQEIEHLAAEQHDIVSFDEDVDAITVQLLKDDPRCLTFSIMGASGTGKTSLAKLIFFSKAIVDHFPHRFWVSRANSIEQILGSLGVDINLEHNDTLASYENKVTERVISLFEGKKFLIVVDDSNAMRLWERLGRILKGISNGTRIIFTIGHRRGAPPVSETGYTYMLHLRSDEESWELFKHALKKNIPAELDDKLKNNILRKCGGLPKVIVKLGETLSQCNATEEEWSRVLDQLIQDKVAWSQVLQEINQSLPLYLRRCLFHFGLFPLNYKIPARRLFALWITEGLSAVHAQLSPEYVAELCLRHLVNCNMVQVAKKKLSCSTMKFCLPEALRLHWFRKAKETNNRIGVTRYLADHLDQNDAAFEHIHGNSRTSLYSSCYEDMVSFLSFDAREESQAGEDIGNFLNRCISSNIFLFLWVLDLEGVYKPKLPKAVGQLTVLRYLGLRWTYLGILPEFIGKLMNLERLDLKGTCIQTLPISIWEIRKLKHLFLNESNFHVFVHPKEERSLVGLQTLRGLHVDEESPVQNGLDTFLNITKLGLKSKISLSSRKEEMTSQVAAVANWIMNLKHLQYLQWKSFDESSQPWELPRSLCQATTI